MIANPSQARCKVLAGRVWTKEKIVKRIQELHEEGVDLSPTGIQKTHSALFSSARSKSHFGNWRAAILAAGLDYEEIKRGGDVWMEEDILEGIRQAYARGEDILGAEFKERNKKLYLAACAKRYFGSWKSAIIAAQLDYEGIRGQRFWNRERIMEKIVELNRQGEKLIWSLLDRTHPDLYRAARRKENFGSWRNALAQAQISYQEARQLKEWSREAVLEALHELLALGAELNLQAAQDKHPSLLQGAEKHFVLWERAVQEACQTAPD